MIGSYELLAILVGIATGLTFAVGVRSRIASSGRYLFRDERL